MIHIKPDTDMLLIVDPQNDFITGSLAVKDAAEIIPILNKYGEKILNIAVSRDWHPFNHMSFVEQGGPWPVHCVANTEGAMFHKELASYIKNPALIINKAVDQNVDAYSAFDNTRLAKIMEASGIKTLFIGGLATDYCVKATVLDALKIKGLEVYLLIDAIKAVNANPDDGVKAIAEMMDKGAIPLILSEIVEVV